MIRNYVTFVVIVLLLPIMNCGSGDDQRVDLGSPPGENIVLFLGVDGAEWSIIHKMIARGELPNFRSLMEAGTYGELVMTQGKVFSPVVWTSMFTGVHPERHGIMDQKTCLATFRKQKAIWDYMTDAGLPSAVLHVPGSFPPDEIIGIEISGFPMENAYVGDNVGKYIVMKADSGAAVEMHEPIEIEDVSKEQTYLFNLTYNQKDPDGRYRFTLSHNGMDHRVSLVREDFSQWLKFRTPSDILVQTRLRLLSFSGEELELYMSPLARAPDSSWTFVHPASFYDEIEKEIGQYVPQEIGWISLLEKPVALDFIYDYYTDTEKTRVRTGLNIYRRDEWPLFIHVITLPDRIQHTYWPYMDPELYESVPSEWTEAYGDRVEKCYREVDLMLGRYLELADENTTVIIASDHGFKSKGKKRHFLKKLIGEKDEIAKSLEGIHKKEAVYIFSGNHIKDADEGPLMAAVDIAPTILYLLGVDIPDNLDGKVAGYLLEDGYLEKYPPSYVDGIHGLKNQAISESDHQEVLENLRSMGYID